jgi:hypothetical protein
MFYRFLFFALLCLPSSGYAPQTVCSGSTFGKCLPSSYCGVTDTGAYECLPCTAGNLCPGDGYIYTATQLNRQIITINNAKYVANSTYIVSRNRGLIGKKLKRIGKIVKVGLTVAAIAKTGGVAALKKAAAAKAKQMAIRKGIQCLKNGMSNFCNGKKKGTVVKKVKGKAMARVKVKASGIKAKPTGIKAKPTGVKKVKVKQITKSKTSVKKRVPSINSKPTRTSKSKSTPKTSNPCKNIFDTIAEKVNNATRHVADNAVNKGRDWLKKNVGGNASGCGKGSTNLRGSKSKPFVNPKSKPTAVRRRPKSKPGSRYGSTNDDNTNTNAPTSDDNTKTTDDSTLAPVTRQNPRPKSRPVKRRPVPNTDDYSPTGVVVKRKPVPTKARSGTLMPLTRMDDNLLSTLVPTPTLRQGPRPIKKRQPRTNAPITDDVVPTGRPIRTRVVKPREPRTRAPRTRAPRTNAPIITTDDSLYTASPTRAPKRTTRIVRTSRPSGATPTMLPISRPTRLPISRPTRSPTIILTLVPTRLPTRAPTRMPTRAPSSVPTIRPSPRPSTRPTFNPTAVAGPPTMIPISGGGGISWEAFSSAPVSQSSIIPTRFPTVSMFSIMSQIPTTTPSSAATSIIKSATATTSTSTSTSTSTIGQPSLRPTVFTSSSPSVLPTVRSTMSPTVSPTFAPSLIPSASPSVQTTANLLSNGAQASSSTNNSTQTYAIISALVGLIIFAAIGFCLFQLFKRKKTPFQKWVDVYDINSPGAAGAGSSKNINTNNPPSVNDEIHHFYRKDPSSPQNSRFSISRNSSFSIPPNMRESSPAFVPYVPKKESRRYSHQTMVQLNNRL